MMGLVSILVVGFASAQEPARGAHTDDGQMDPVSELLPAGPGLSIPRPPPQIVNGQPVVEPHNEVVALAFEDPVNGRVDVFCTGSLIHPEWVLTAAHCIIPVSEGPFGSVQVVMWGNQSSFPEETIPWAESFREPRYIEGEDVLHDIGLVHLSVPKEDPVLMVLNDAPIEETWVGTVLTFFGFGVTGDLLVDSGIKRTTDIAITSFDLSDVGTFSPGTNVCFGDSGGPSTFLGLDGPEQVGVSSTVFPGCVGGSAESARVDAHLGWIAEHVPELILDYADLPVEEIEGPDEGPGRNWDDLGADDVNGLNGAFSGRTPVPGGCAHLSHGVGWLGLLVGLLTRRRYLAARGSSR